MDTDSRRFLSRGLFLIPSEMGTIAPGTVTDASMTTANGLGAPLARGVDLGVDAVVDPMRSGVFSWDIRALRAAGGIVIGASDACCPSDARLPEAPLPTFKIDAVAPLDDAVTLAHSYRAKALRVLASLEDDRALAVVSRELVKRYGMSFAPEPRGRLARCFARQAAVQADGRLDDHVAAIRSSGTAAMALLRLLVNSAPAGRWTLPEQIIQSVVASAGPGEEIRVWHAGCGDGAASWVLGSILEAALARRSHGARLAFLATDPDPERIALARAGVYPPTLQALLPSDGVATIFERRDQMFQVRADHLDLIAFVATDFFSGFAPEHVDLAVLSESFGLLDRSVEMAAAEILVASVRPGGFVWLPSGATPPTPVASTWQPVGNGAWRRPTRTACMLRRHQA